MKEKFNKIDEILASYEDRMHGIDGYNCTKARRLLRETQEQSNKSDVSMDKNRELTDKFQQWLDTNPRKNAIAAGCVSIVERWHDQKLEEKMLSDKELTEEKKSNKLLHNAMITAEKRGYDKAIQEHVEQYHEQKPLEIKLSFSDIEYLHQIVSATCRTETEKVEILVEFIKQFLKNKNKQ